MSVAQSPSELADLFERGGDSANGGGDEVFHQLAALAAVFLPVGRHNSLVDGPGDLYGGVAFFG
jgi:hypothetical protein